MPQEIIIWQSFNIHSMPTLPFHAIVPISFCLLHEKQAANSCCALKEWLLETPQHLRRLKTAAAIHALTRTRGHMEGVQGALGIGEIAVVEVDCEAQVLDV